MRVDMNIGYPAVWQDITTTGHFNPEEGSIRGAVTWQDGAVGEFVFKRDPDFVRFYPAPSTTDARARWKFVTAVILDRIRRQSWSPSYILKRIKDVKRYMELGVRDEHYGKRLNDDERREFDGLLSSLYEPDARFYASRINIKLSQVTIQYVDVQSSLARFLVSAHTREYSTVTCGSCGAVIAGARVLCMDCHDKYTLDLCSEPECLNSVGTLECRPDLETPHTPNHDMLKVHCVLFGRDVARTERDAKVALEAARNTISDLKAGDKPMPECVCCRSVVSLPCWYCTDCIGGFPQKPLEISPCSSEFFFEQRRSSSVPIVNISASRLTMPTPRSTCS